MLKRALFVLSLTALVGAFGCTTVGPSIALSGLPAVIVDGGTYTLTLTGSPGSSAGLWTYTLSSSCGGTFTLVSPPGLPVAGNLIIGPTNASSVQVNFAVTNPTADLSVTKSDTPDPVGVGYTLTYTLTVGNTGSCTITAKLTTASGRTSTTSQNTNVSAGNVVLTDTLPANVTFVSATPSQGSCSGTATVTCALGTIAHGASATVTIQVTPQAGAVPSITNSVSVTGAVFDPNTANNSDTEDTTVNPVADLSVSKGDSPDPVTYGQNVTYTITVTNGGPSDATNVTLTDTLPSNVTFVSASAGCTYNSGPHTVTCSWASIAASGSHTVTIVVKAKAAGIDLVVDDDTGACAYTGIITDTASVTADEHDPDLANNSASANTTVNKNHSTIGAAIAAASAGQKIFVCPGTYNENPRITKALTLRGAGIPLVNINPAFAGYGIEVSGAGSNVTLEQFTLNAGNSRHFMIHVSGVSNFTIQNVKVVGAGKTVTPGGQPLGGVDLNNVMTALIKNVEVQDVSRNGISLTNSTGVTIDTANVHDTGVSTGWAGIAVYATVGTSSATFAGTSTVTNTPMGLYVEDFTGTTVNLTLSGGITFSGQAVAPIVRYGLGTVPGLEATGPTATFAYPALGLVARLTAPDFPSPPINKGAAFFYTVSDAIAAAQAAGSPYVDFAVVRDLENNVCYAGPTFDPVTCQPHW